MSPTQLFEPTYLAIKRRLMAGHWPSGYRLDTAKLATQLDVSKSPVRDSLNRLAGERMADFVPGVGFEVPRLDVLRLQQLMDFNLYLLGIVAGISPSAGPETVDAGADPAERAAVIFRHMAMKLGNDALSEAIEGLNDRLWSVRLLDSDVLPKPTATLDALYSAIVEAKPPMLLQRLLGQYHAERRREFVTYVRLLAARKPRED